MEGKARVIVLVDDDIDFAEITSHFLTERGYEVHTFPFAQEALAFMVEQKPDLVITDLMMESLDSGFAFSRRIKEMPSLCNVPVILVTAASSRRGFDFGPSSAEDLDAMHIRAFMEKPVNPKKLLATIDGILNVERA